MGPTSRAGGRNFLMSASLSLKMADAESKTQERKTQTPKALIMTDQTGNKVPETGRKRASRKKSGSQTEDNESCSGCRNMADTITEMNRKLDLVLARVEETDEIKEKQKRLEKVSAELGKSLEFAHESIKILTVQVDA